jgi:hypothetical protein
MAYTIVDVAAIDPAPGPHPTGSPYDKGVAHVLGIRAFGLYQVELPPGAETVGHNHLDDGAEVERRVVKPLRRWFERAEIPTDRQNHVLSMTTELGRLETVDPRTVWPHEAHGFTPWLLENGDRLAEALGIDLDLEASEHSVGGYKLDLVGRDITNDAVLIVENQLAITDHSHLGQVLTYAAGTEASTIVWIATAFREEHRQALDWLNENTGEQAHFFGIELQVVKIGNSVSAPLFKVVVQPNDWQKQVRASTQPGAVSGKGALYMQFWGRFLERVHTEHPDWTKAKAVGTSNWFEMKSPVRGCIISSSFAQSDRLRQELYIDTGEGGRNNEIFEYFIERRGQLETAYGRPLEWEELPNRRACRIADYMDGCSVSEDSRHEEFIGWFLDAGVRLRRALDAIPSPPS